MLYVARITMCLTYRTFSSCQYCQIPGFLHGKNNQQSRDHQVHILYLVFNANVHTKFVPPHSQGFAGDRFQTAGFLPQ